MKTVSFQGTQLSASQKRTMHRQQTVFINHHLASAVDSALDATEERKAAGVKPARLWTVERQERGTPYLGDTFNFERKSPCQNSM